MMQAIKDTLRDHPYLALLTGFAFVVAPGCFKLITILSTVTENI